MADALPRCRPSSDAAELRAGVAARDLPRAARAAKRLLDRRAVVQLASAVLAGAADGGVDERWAAAVCGCMSDATAPGDAARARRAAAALLLTAMRSVTGASPPPPGAGGAAVEALVSPSGADIALAQPCRERAAAFAAAMTRAMPAAAAASLLAAACGRVTARHGAARDPAALLAFASCPMLARAPGDAAPAALLLQACARAAYVPPHQRAAVVPSAELEAALAADGPRSARRSAAPPPAPPTTDDALDADKLCALWTYVHRDGSAEAAAASAAAAAAASPAPSRAPETKTIRAAGGGAAAVLARVTML